jgi:transcriptional regulator with XRE-family HTH domain
MPNATVNHMDTREEGASFNAAVAAVLRAERAAHQLTYDQLAQDSGITRVTLVRILNNKRAITVTQLFQLSKPLKITPQEIIHLAMERLNQ